MEIRGPSYGRKLEPTRRGRYTAQTHDIALSQRTGALPEYRQRPKPDTVYPQGRNLREIEGGFMLDFPEIKFTKTLKQALEQSLKDRRTDRPVKWEVSEGRDGGIEIKVLGELASHWDLLPVSQQMTGMLQAGLGPDEMAGLMILFDGLHYIGNDGKGGVSLDVPSSGLDEKKYPSQMHVAKRQVKIIDSLLQLGFPDLAKQALKQIWIGFTWHLGFQRRDNFAEEAKELAWS